MTTRFGPIQILQLALIWGLVVGLGAAAVVLLDEGYLRHGLLRLASRTLGKTAGTYLAVAGAGGALAALLRLLASPVLERGTAWARTLTGLTVFLLAALPPWAWTAVRYRDLYPRDVEVVWTAFAVACALHVAAFLALRRRVRSPTSPERWRRVLLLAAAASVLVAGTLVAAHRFGELSRSAARGRPNVLILMLDTVRADRLSCYGYHRDTTPAIDRLAADGIRFSNFYSTAPWTVPSHASLFTGLFSARHRATQENLRLDSGFVTLAEALGNLGYRTWGASANPAASQYTNMSQGFVEFEQTWRRRKGHGRSHPNVLAFGRFLSRSDPNVPYFAFLNFVDTHFPYAPPEPYLSRFLDPALAPAAALELGHRHWAHHFLQGPDSPAELALLSDLYDGEIADLDHTIGELLAIVRADSRYDDTLIIVTSDHGEHFGENGLVEHVFGLYNTTIRIPLVIRLPGGTRAGEVYEGGAQIVDLFPTILRLAGVDDSRWPHHGHDLLGDPPPARKAIFSEYYFPAWTLSRFKAEELAENGARLLPYLRRLQAYQEDGYRFIWSSDGKHELYNLTRDAGETQNLYDPADPVEVAREYLGRLRRSFVSYAEGSTLGPLPTIDRVAPRLAESLDDETLDTLRSLGYVE